MNTIHDNGELMKSFRIRESDENLQDISVPFREIADEIYEKIEPSAERTIALHKLLESKDWAIAAILEQNKGGNYAEGTDTQKIERHGADGIG